MSSLRSLVVAVLAVLSLSLCGFLAAQDAAPGPGPSKFAPWDRNSIQPPPAVEPVKLPPTAPQPGDGEAERLLRAAVSWFDGAVSRVDDMVPAAEAVADKLIAGGHLYCTGSPGFVQELYGRAGGLSFLQEWTGQKLTADDVLFIGLFTPHHEGSRQVAFAALTSGGGWNIPGLVVHFSSHHWTEISRTIPLVNKRQWGNRLFLIDTGAPEGGSWSDVSLGQMAAAATAHAFEGEVFAAASRKGKTIGTLASDAEPHGREWDKTTEDRNLNPKFPVPAIPAGKIGRDYLRICQRQLADFLEAGEANQVRLAAKRLADAMRSGHAVFIVVSGHIHTQGAIIPRDFPRMVMYGRSWEWRSSVLQPGDVLLWLGYLDYPKGDVEKAIASQAQAVTLSVANGPTDQNRTHIRSFWEKWDSIINVPDYPVRILASSGVVQTAQWYALVAETERLMGK